MFRRRNTSRHPDQAADGPYHDTSPARNAPQSHAAMPSPRVPGGYGASTAVERAGVPATPTKPELPKRVSELAMVGPAKRSAEPVVDRDMTRKLTVGREIILTGEISTCDSLLVDGMVEARLRDCRAITISATGAFKGSAEIESADIAGNFEGDLIVRGRLKVRATGFIRATVQYAELEVEPGGRITGNIEPMDTEPSGSDSEASAYAADAGPSLTVRHVTPNPEPDGDEPPVDADGPPKTDTGPAQGELPEPAPAMRAAETHG